MMEKMIRRAILKGGWTEGTVDWLSAAIRWNLMRIIVTKLVCLVCPICIVIARRCQAIRCPISAKLGPYLA